MACYNPLFPNLPPPPPPLLGEDEVFNAFELLLGSSIDSARSKGLIRADSGGEPLNVIGSALCLYYSAMGCDARRFPSVLITQSQYDTTPKWLYRETCPQAFRSLFGQWAEAVPSIQALSQYERDELERVICSGSPLPLRPTIPQLPPYNFPSMAFPTPNPVHQIAEALLVLARQISGCRAYRIHQRRTSYLLNINTNSSWPTIPLVASPVQGISPSLQHPSPQMPSGSVFGHPHSDSPPTSHSSTPTPDPTSTYSPVVSPGSTNDLGGFIGGFRLLDRGATVPTQGFTTPHMPFPSPQPYDMPRPTLVDSQHKRYTVAHPDYSEYVTYDHTSSTADSTATVIGSHTSKLDIITELVTHGCEDFSHLLNHNSFGSHPNSWGGCGGVYRGALLDGRQVAVKAIFTQRGDEKAKKHLKHTARELHIWSKCKHPNVAELMGFAEFHGQLAMVSLWMENGNLRDFVKENPDVNRLDLCTQMTSGLEHLHLSGIVHGDLKGSNVLISNTRAPILIDFGNAIQSNPTMQFTNTGTKSAMTTRWAAPEILRGGQVSKEADVYALGMDFAIIHAVLNEKKLPDRPEEIPRNSVWGDSLWRVLVNCWSHEPHRRLAAPYVHQHLRGISEASPPPVLWYAIQ
ncbi:hypothetical protein FRC07_000140 [Ceratobasidium sp. 392]|nr:hypothetical protein FRC07_000140 [Ceratobasidium sp. 392]